LAVVLVIVGLLVAGGIAAIDTTLEQSNRSQQRKQLDIVRDALYGFAMSNGRLPCPDESTPRNGRENTTSGTPPFDCSVEEGVLPWVTLGIEGSDAWGQPLRYRVTPDFADDDGDAASFEIGDRGEVEIYSSNDQVSGDPDVAEDVVAVVIAFGVNGNQVWSGSGAAITCPAGGTAGFSDDENQNCNGDPNGSGTDDRAFVRAGYRRPDVNNGFDDMMVWIPYPVLSMRMVDAGKLP
jgi:type II secretory pathway pseudopilin PulG